MSITSSELSNPGGEWPSIRLITPSFNQGQYIEATLDSILSQNYPNLTFFVADGGSKDNTVEILKRRLPSNQWRSKKDGGQVDCLIESFRQGNEEILCWVNSDDLLYPDVLRQIGKLFQADPDLAMVVGEGAVTDSTGKPLFCKASLAIDPRQLEEHCCILQPATFFRRSWYEKVGGLDIRLSKAFDYELWLKIVKAGGKTRHVQDLFAVFRLHDNCQTVALWPAFLPEILAIQWRHGDRRQFARRYAAARARLCLEGQKTPAEADAYLGETLERLLPNETWRDTLKPAEGYTRAMACIRRAKFKPSRWYKFPVLLWQLLIHPSAIPGFFSLMGNILATGHWRLGTRMSQFEKHQRKRSDDVRAHRKPLPKM